jgi:hypothetical protein
MNALDYSVPTAFTYLSHMFKIIEKIFNSINVFIQLFKEDTSSNNWCLIITSVVSAIWINK